MNEQYTSTYMISVEEALATILSRVDLAAVERVAIHESIGRVLAEDIASDIDIAPFDNSSMDGFAVRSADFVSVSDTYPLTLDIIGVLGAGSVFADEVLSGQALRIMTGAPMPGGADTVVKIEDTQVLGEGADAPFGTQVAFVKEPKRGANVRLHGEDARKGDVLLHSGDVISMAAVGLLASTGHAQVDVYGRPRVAVFSSGSELVDAQDVPGPGQIRNSNSHALAAAVIDAGGIPVLLPRVKDTREALAATLAAAAEDSDFVVLSGGAAEGDFDFTTPVVRELGEVLFNKVNMRPGKAQTYGIIGSTPIFGLPGNPAASAVGFEVLVRPALRKMQGFTDLTPAFTEAKVTTAIKKREPRRQYLRAVLAKAADGSFTVTPNKNQSSALYSALNSSNCLLVLPEGLEPVDEGDRVTCLRLDIPEGAVL